MQYWNTCSTTVLYRQKIYADGLIQFFVALTFTDHEYFVYHAYMNNKNFCENCFYRFTKTAKLIVLEILILSLYGHSLYF